MARHAWSGYYFATPSFQALDDFRRFEASAGLHGFGGGTDPKHLTPHERCWEPYQVRRHHQPEAPEGVEIVREDARRRVSLIVPRFEDWPVELGRLSGRLATGKPSWHIHVIARDFGFIGTFRRCWECDRWFQGRAKYHVWGHGGRPLWGSSAP